MLTAMNEEPMTLNENVVTMQQGKAAKDQVKVAKDQVKVAKERVRAAKDQVKVAKDQVKVAKDQVKVAKDADPDLLQDWDGKHPLNNSWVLWYSDRTKANKDWTDCIKEVGPFDTVEDFWGLFNFLKPVSMLKVGCDFYLFKKGIQPMWEDASNKNGGRWDVTVESVPNRQRIDDCWMELLMVVVGEQFFDVGSVVNGVCVSRRDRNSRISIWTSVANDRDKIMFLGKKIKHVLGIPQGQHIHFRAHQTSPNCQPNLLYVC